MSERKPEVRFEGFEDEWKNLKIDEVGTITAGGDIDKSQLSEKGKYPVIANAITNKGIVGYYDTFTINTPAVTITGRGDIGFAFARDENFTPVVRLLVIEPKEKINHYFLANSINNLNIFHESTGVPQLTSPQISRLEITVPGYNEQKYIGTFFKKIENTIENKQTEFKKMKQFKQAMLQKMFPKEGETIPEVRFEGFTDQWKSYELADVSNIKTGDRDVNESKADGRYPFFIRSDEVKKINSYSYDGEAILTAGDGRIGEVFHYINGKFDYHQRVYKISGFEEVLGKHIYYELERNFKKHIMSLNAKGTVNSIRMPMLLKYSFLSPCLNEQEAITNYFTKLDKTIESKQKELDKLKQFKQAMLDKMFV